MSLTFKRHTQILNAMFRKSGSIPLSLLKVPSTLGFGFALLVACSDDTSMLGEDASGGDEEPAELAGITRFHNEVRATVGVGPVVWDSRLATIAAMWAAKCVDSSPRDGLIDHNTNRSQSYPSYVGENVFGSSGDATAKGAVDSWASERTNYDYPSNVCSGVCGHYTQIVWRNSTMIGCAKSSCSGLMYSSTIVCNYGPGGNISGERPY